jgi:hypothetical protein
VKDLKNWAGILVLTFALFGGVYGAMKVFATNERVDLVQLRLEQKIQADQAWELQRQIHQLEDRYYDPISQHTKPVSSWQPHDAARYRQLIFDLDQLHEGGREGR